MGVVMNLAMCNLRGENDIRILFEQFTQNKMLIIMKLCIII